ncbi:hypothetical protein M408DRAFT_330955 [Serendipita vermifera MAFF 305830]|uniref:Amine oxidase domain-containing protein n=1 Tax=Serendipita vermifera MAFF 305830 TaxID=933852 RepID=A0A0C2X953_SERVB|nr:hypothetical protein M408DRAFT_330955 [Serendipita vermifera MAFF 305830]
MSFSVTRDKGAFEYGGENLVSLFCQFSNLFKSSMWRMIWDILRFNASARRLLAESESAVLDSKVADAKATSLGAYLKANGYSDSFRDDYLLPIATSIWSTPPSECADGFSARSILRFMHNHHLLQITGKPKWLTVKGGSINYVNKVISKLPPGALRLSTPVHSVRNSTVDGKHKVLLRTVSGHVEEYDHVIMATHSGTTLRILENGEQATADEKAILGGFQWTNNPTVLHSDTSALPTRKKAWCAWNYVTESEPPTALRPGRSNSDQFGLSYLMNLVQHINMDTFGPVICTLNPTIAIREETIQARGNYEHPTFNAQAEECQKRMPTIQNTRSISYAGAWMGYGFHEDGFTMGLKAAVALGGVQLPFEILPANRRVNAVWTANLFDILERIRLFLVWLLFGMFARLRLRA